MDRQAYPHRPGQIVSITPRAKSAPRLGGICLRKPPAPCTRISVVSSATMCRETQKLDNSSDHGTILGVGKMLGIAHLSMRVCLTVLDDLHVFLTARSQSSSPLTIRGRRSGGRPWRRDRAARSCHLDPSTEGQLHPSPLNLVVGVTPRVRCQSRVAGVTPRRQARNRAWRMST